MLHRCLVDSQLSDSRSQFLPRIQDDKLHLVIDTFKFHNEDKGQVRLQATRLDRDCARTVTDTVCPPAALHHMSSDSRPGKRSAEQGLHLH